MKLKPIVASLMLLGLAAPAFADDSATQAQLDQMKAQINKMQAVINQNGSGAFQLQQPADWMSRITISGLANLDAGYGTRAPIFRSASASGGGNVSNIDLNNANVLVDAAINDWTTAHMNLMASSNVHQDLAPVFAATSTDSNRVLLDEAYVTLGNFAQSPLYFRGGKEYVPFGVYDLYPMVVNPTQALTQNNATAAQVGFVSPMGLYGAVYGFRGLTQANDAVNNRAAVKSYGADLGWTACTSAWGVKLDAGYINNMADVDYVGTSTGLLGSYVSKVPAYSLHAGFNVQQFDIKGDYVSAASSFDTADLTYNGSGAKPKAYGAEAGYSFPVMNNHTSRVALGYQHTRDAVNVGTYGLPLTRWYGMYTVNVSKWTDVGFELYRDRGYSVSNGGTGNNATVGQLRLGVKFA
jgi:hypothetical protein